MNRRVRQVGPRLFFTLASALIVAVLAMGAGHGTQDRDEVSRMTNAVKTVCVGRFLIDLPREAQVSLGRTAVDGFEITVAAPESDSEFQARVAAREAQLKKEKNPLGRRSIESAQEIREEGKVGKVFVFGRNTTHVYHGDQKVTLTQVAINAFVRTGGVSFDLVANDYDPAQAGNIVRLVGKLRARAEDDIPADPGFCIERGMIRDPLAAGQGERAVLFAGLPGHPDLAIAFSTMAGTRSGPGLLARNAQTAAGQPALVRALIGTLRQGPRAINGLHGEELALRVREVNFATTYGFDWEMGGSRDDVLAPFLTLEMQAGLSPRAGGKPVQSTLSEAALLELWDKVSSSIRIRRANPPPAAKPEPPVSPLGTMAVAGDPCPQSGWWLCSEGGNGVGVLGGQRQYVRKGERMPQALLLPPQTLWQKVRGLQPSYESRVPTPWKLVDKRARARTLPPVALAQPQLVAGIDGAAAAAAAQGAHGASLGSFVKTGEACPASGWWRCEEPHALDGTRWFAGGCLLPAATFQVPPGAFGRARGAPEAIQRRSSWQLVRYAPGPDPAATAGAQATGDANMPSASQA